MSNGEWQVIATRNTRERSNRLENMCWRIWHLTRKKKQVKTPSSKAIEGNKSSNVYCSINRDEMQYISKERINCVFNLLFTNLYYKSNSSYTSKSKHLLCFP